MEHCLVLPLHLLLVEQLLLVLLRRFIFLPLFL